MENLKILLKLSVEQHEKWEENVIYRRKIKINVSSEVKLLDRFKPDLNFESSLKIKNATTNRGTIGVIND